VYTRANAPGALRPPGRLRAEDLAPLLRDGATVYVCGSPAFADAASDLLVELDVPVGQIRVERFGPTG
jgi:ferredoxin-NADP reductase